MLVRVSTPLDTSADRAWETVQKADTLRYVTRGLLGFRADGGEVDNLGEGDVVRVKLLFFHFVPAWSHEIRIVRVDQRARTLYTNERGGPVSHWNHRISIEPAGEGRAHYTDEIEIRAGIATPLVWAYAQLFYRYRQWRWRRLARTL